MRIGSYLLYRNRLKKQLLELRVIADGLFVRCCLRLEEPAGHGVEGHQFNAAVAQEDTAAAGE